MNWHFIKRRLRLFDERGLDAETIHILQLLIATVAFGIVWTNVTTGVALTGYFKLLGASDTLYGLVFALPALANAFQFICSYLLERMRKPRKMMLIAGLIQRTVWIPIAFIPYIIPQSAEALRLIAAVVMAIISASMAPFMNVSFYMMASIVPMRIRGRYFATRTRVSTLIGLVVGLLVGLLLDVLPGYSAYTAVFCLAGVFGSVDILCYLRMPDIKMPPIHERKRLWPMLRAVLRDKPYMKTVLILTAWLFTVQITSPYHNVYAHSVLGISSFNVILTGQIANNLCLIFCISHWGRAIDSYGNRPVLIVAAFLNALYPLMWVRVEGPLMLAIIFFSNAWSGGIYCAVDLTLQNLFMGQAREENRSMYFAVYFLFTQLFGLALGSSVGGMLLDNVLSPIDGMGLMLGGAAVTRYNALFLIGGLMRLLVVFGLLIRLKDEGAQPVGVFLRDGQVAFMHKARAIRARWMRRRLHAKYRREQAPGDDGEGGDPT